MASLIKGENKVTAGANLDFEKAGLNADNCEVIFETGASPKSWKPGGKLNSLTKFTKGNTYLITAKQGIEISKL